MWLRSSVDPDAEMVPSLVGELGGSSDRSLAGRGLVGRLNEGGAGREGDGTTGDGREANILDGLGGTTLPIGGGEDGGERERERLLPRDEGVKEAAGAKVGESSVMVGESDVWSEERSVLGTACKRQQERS